MYKKTKKSTYKSFNIFILCFSLNLYEAFTPTVHWRDRDDNSMKQVIMKQALTESHRVTVPDTDQIGHSITTPPDIPG